MTRRFKSLDEARGAYLNGKITKEEFASLIRKYSISDNVRRELSKNAKKIEKKLLSV